MLQRRAISEERWDQYGVVTDRSFSSDCEGKDGPGVHLFTGKMESFRNHESRLCWLRGEWDFYRPSSPDPTFPGRQSLVCGELAEQTTGYRVSRALREPEPSDDFST